MVSSPFVICLYRQWGKVFSDIEWDFIPLKPGTRRGEDPLFTSHFSFLIASLCMLSSVQPGLC